MRVIDHTGCDVTTTWTAALGGIYGDALSQMWPMSAGGAGPYINPPETTAAVEDEKPVDPRTAAEDRCRALWDSASEFEKATLRWLSGTEGWTDARALDVRTREWRKPR
jgi:hypothetical protein